MEPNISKTFLQIFFNFEYSKIRVVFLHSWEIEEILQHSFWEKILWSSLRSQIKHVSVHSTCSCLWTRTCLLKLCGFSQKCQKKIARWTCPIAFPKRFHHWTRKNTGNRRCPIKLKLSCLFLFFEKSYYFFTFLEKSHPTIKIRNITPMF